MSHPVHIIPFDISQLDFSKSGGLVTVVTQDVLTGAVLMVAHADREALERTLQTGEMHYRSRSRGLWHKGGTSGNVQRVVSLSADCDADAQESLLLAQPHEVAVPRTQALLHTQSEEFL